MMSRLEVKNFRMLRENAVSLGRFVVLVGKNATGKSTLIGALRFVSDLVRGGVQLALSNALEREAPNFSELCFDPTQPLEFAVELGMDGRRVRYETRVGPDAGGAVAVHQERLFLLPSSPAGAVVDGVDAQRSLRGKVRDYLRDGVTHLELDGAKLRQPSVPGSPTRLLPDGMTRRSLPTASTPPSPHLRTKRGIDAFGGNMPFLGGRRIATQYGERYAEWLTEMYAGTGDPDYVGNSFHRASPFS